MKWIFDITKQKINYYIYVSMIVMGDLSSVLTPILFGKLVDEFLTNGPNPNIWAISLGIFITILLGATFAFTGVVLANRFSSHMSRSIRNACYTHLNELDRNFHYGNDIGEVTTMITSDLSSISHFLTDTVKNLLFVFISFSAVFIYCILLKPSLTLLILLPAPIIGYLSFRHMKTSPPFYDARREGRKKINTYIGEVLEGIKVIRVLATEEKDKKSLRDLNSKLSEKSLELETVRLNYNIKVRTLSESMNLILILFGGLLLIKGTITIGDIVMFKSFMWILKQPFMRLAYYIDDYQEYKLSRDKIKHLLDTEPKIQDEGELELTYQNEEIIFDNVSLHFDELCAVRNINLKIKPGSTIACIGEVGSGKSSIINLLLRFVDPSSGTILIGDTDYKRFSIKSLRDTFGYVSQTPFLYSDTIKSNVTYGNQELSDEEIISYLKMAKADYVFDLEEGINTIIGENGVNLSGGEKQRLSLARALAKNPKVLILDDTTSALDIETEVSVTENIEKIPKKITKIIIAQKIFSVRNADQILVFKDNTIVESGTHQELLAKNGEYKIIYDLNEGGDDYGN